MFNNSLISDFILSDNIPQYQNKTWSGEVITRIVGTQYFSISFKVTTSKKYRTDLTNFLALYSNGRPFDMSLGWWGDYSGNQATGVQVTAARTAGATSIQTNTNNLSPGDLIQFSGHKKLYRVIARSGTTLNIYPGLIRNLQIGETVKYDNLMGSFILTPANSTYDLPSTNIIEMTITATENIRG